MAYIDIENLDYYYPEEEKKALNNINLKINSGEMVLVVGRSGSGKSTLAKALTGAVPYFYGGSIKGSVKIDNVDLSKMDHYTRANTVTMVFQDPERQLMMNKVHREIAFGLENIGVEGELIKRRVFEALQFANILPLAYRDINTLSGGEKQKVAVTSAIAYMPGCIVLDEPTSQLDPSAAEEIASLVKRINEELGITIVIVEQRVNRWFDLVDKICFMEEGTLESYDSREEFYRAAYHEAEEASIKTRSLFLPDYLKLGVELREQEVPVNFKEARLFYKEHYSFGAPSIVQKTKLEPMLTIKKLSSYYGDNRVLNNLDLEIRRGEFTAVLGANGAGKSTFLKTIMGIKEYSGSIKLQGEEIKKQNTKTLARKIGYVSQNPNDYISRDTVYEELKFTLDNHNIKEQDIIDETLKELNIYELKDKNPRDISGGQRQRVAIASMLVLKPSVLLLDEPTRGLDREAKEKLGRLLKALNEKGTTIIMVTHDMEFAASFCSNFLLFFNGEIAARGDGDRVLSGALYYTTSINKLLRGENSHLYTIDQALAGAKRKS